MSGCRGLGLALGGRPGGRYVKPQSALWTLDARNLACDFNGDNLPLTGAAWAALGYPAIPSDGVSGDLWRFSAVSGNETGKVNNIALAPTGSVNIGGATAPIQNRPCPGVKLGGGWATGVELEGPADWSMKQQAPLTALNPGANAFLLSLVFVAGTARPVVSPTDQQRIFCKYGTGGFLLYCYQSARLQLYCNAEAGAYDLGVDLPYDGGLHVLDVWVSLGASGHVYVYLDDHAVVTTPITTTTVTTTGALQVGWNGSSQNWAPSMTVLLAAMTCGVSATPSRVGHDALVAALAPALPSVGVAYAYTDTGATEQPLVEIASGVPAPRALHRPVIAYDARAIVIGNAAGMGLRFDGAGAGPVYTSGGACKAWTPTACTLAVIDGATGRRNAVELDNTGNNLGKIQSASIAISGDTSGDWCLSVMARSVSGSHLCSATAQLLNGTGIETISGLILVDTTWRRLYIGGSALYANHTAISITIYPGQWNVATGVARFEDVALYHGAAVGALWGMQAGTYPSQRLLIDNTDGSKYHPSKGVVWLDLAALRLAVTSADPGTLVDFSGGSNAGRLRWQLISPALYQIDLYDSVGAIAATLIGTMPDNRRHTWQVRWDAASPVLGAYHAVSVIDGIVDAMAGETAWTPALATAVPNLYLGGGSSSQPSRCLLAQAGVW